MIEKTPFSLQAAKASWLAPLIAVGLGIAVKSINNSGSPGGEDTVRAVTLIVGGIGLAIVVAGLVLGITALFGLKKHGAKGILVPAIIGILLSSGYLYLVINAILVIRRLIDEGVIKPQ